MNSEDRWKELKDKAGKGERKHKPPAKCSSLPLLSILNEKTVKEHVFEKNVAGWWDFALVLTQS